MTKQNLTKLTAETLQNFNQASRREWLETNGLGGYASQTAAGSNSRRYHGLLTAALNPPRNRYVLFSKVEENLRIGSETFELSTNQYRLAVHPQGFQYLTHFTADPFPVWIFEAGGARISKTIFMPYGKNQTILIYELLSAPQNVDITLEVKPFIAYRDYHGLAKENSFLNSQVQMEAGRITFHPYEGLPALRIDHNAAGFDDSQKCWYQNFEYIEELNRGLEAYEDLFCTGSLRFSLSQSKCAYLSAGIDQEKIENLEDIQNLRKEEILRRERLSQGSDSDFIRILKRAADQFVVRRADGSPTVIAGYHWFTDWGRDTMIALPGLLIATGRTNEAKLILEHFLKYLDQGMLPNFFPDAGERPEYNTVDATLWLFEIIRQYMDQTRDTDFLKAAWPKLLDIIEWHQRGTRFGIKVDPSDGLLAAGEPGVQLTWMDAKVGDWVVTPRTGKAVEINALWHQALCVMAQLAQDLNDTEAAGEFNREASRVRGSFEAKFWNAAGGNLFDFIQGDYKNNQIRPNQIFAVSLSDSLLPREKQKAVVRNVEKHLLTPYGLRTLPAEDKDYIGIYSGGPRERDGAYHQGTVWPWLLGPFISAYLRAFGRSKENLRYTRDLLRGFEKHFGEAGLQTVSEIFDASPPHAAKGCIAQAWSVAEILRVLSQEFGELNSPRTGYKVMKAPKKQVKSKVFALN